MPTPMRAEGNVGPWKELQVEFMRQDLSPALPSYGMSKLVNLLEAQVYSSVKDRRQKQHLLLGVIAFKLDKICRSTL